LEVGYGVLRPVALLLTSIALVVANTADDAHHHDALSDQQLGTVHFPVSCAPGIQKDFERGVALLHSFAFDTAGQTFRQVLEKDPRCAMAHWGIAESKWRWDTDATRRQQGLEEVKAGERLRPPTRREQDYLKALGKFYARPEDDKNKRVEAFNRAMEKLVRKNPEDHEAQAFYAWSLIAADDETHAKRKKAAAILERLFVEEPNHPGVAHYLIHAYDIPGMAEMGLPAARRYAQIAPVAPHALHMPSHIFARLGLWQEDISSNLASITASRNAGATHMGDEGHQYHAMEFLVYAYLQSGREREAQQVIEELKILPKMKNMYGTDYDPNISAQVEYSASYVMELRRWKDAVALPLLTADDDGDSSLTYRARAIGAARFGDLQTAKLNLRALGALHLKLVEKKKTLPANAVDEDRRVVQAWIDHVERKNDESLKLLEEIARKDEGLFATDGDTPAHEMMGDMLLEMNRPEQALLEYEAELKVSPNRFNSLYGAGRASEASKDLPKATAYYQQLLKACAGGDSKRPEILHAEEFTSRVAGRD
jgi:tetratricopeptide (TPR) repeat protein